jgi:hypothetical protein
VAHGSRTGEQQTETGENPAEQNTEDRKSQHALLLLATVVQVKNEVNTGDRRQQESSIRENENLAAKSGLLEERRICLAGNDFANGRTELGAWIDER